MNARWWLVCAWMVSSSVVWGQENNEIVDAQYVLKPHSAQNFGWMTAYTDRPQFALSEGLSHEPYQDSRYTSFGFGPSFDINPQVRAYGLVGAATIAHSDNVTDMPMQALSFDNDARMYGVGMSIRPTEQWHINMQYQNADLQQNNQDSKQVNYFNLGVAFRFK